MPTTNFINGVTNVQESQALGSYVAPDPTKCHAYMNDFDQFSVNTVTTALADWFPTLVGSTGTSAVITNADGGVVLVTNGTTASDSLFFQWKGGQGATVVETWKFEAGKPLWFKCRWKVSDATQSNVVIGLQITDPSPLSVTDGVYFLKLDGSTTVNLLVTKNSTSTTTAAATLANDTYVTLAFFYDGSDRIDIFLNDVRVASSVTTNLPDDEELTISFGIGNGEAAAKTMSVDYIFVAKQRDTEIA